MTPVISEQGPRTIPGLRGGYPVKPPLGVLF